MKKKLLENICQRFIAFETLARQLNAENLAQQCNVPKNKSLGEHFWCLIGARESYTRAIEAGAWQGFACSLNTLEHADIQQALTSSAKAFTQMMQDQHELSAAQSELLLSLYEHEVMHEGQMIRQCYALALPFPNPLRWA